MTSIAKAEGQKRIMHAFKLYELSGVDRPAQAHAKMTLMKRDDVGAILSLYKRWIDPCDGAVPFPQVVQTNADHDKFYRATNAASEELNALDTSLRSIIGDKNIAAVEKESMMRNTVEEFLVSIRGKMPEVEEALMKVLADDPESIAKGETMAQNNQVTVEDLQKMLDKQTAENAELTKKLNKAMEDLEALRNKPSDDEEEYMAGEKMDDKMKKSFMSLEKADRAKKIAEKRASDEVIKIGDTEIRKSVVGAASFAVFKAQDEQIKKQQADLAKEQDLRKRAELREQVKTVYKNLPGTEDEQVDVLKAVGDLPEAVRKTLNTMLEAGSKAVDAAFKTVGHGGAPISKSAGEFMKKVDEIQSANKNLSKQEALQKARRDHPELFAAYQGNGAN